MVVLSFDQVLEFNRLMGSLGCKLHLSDACGGQSMRLEALEGGAPEEAALAAVEEYFAGQGIALRRLSDGASWRAVE